MMRLLVPHRFRFLAAIVVPTTLSLSPSPKRENVNAVLGTEEVTAEGDAADDPAIWVHPDDPSQSLVLGTDKQSGLMVFDLKGKMLQKLNVGRLNNVDLREGFRLGGATITLVAAGNRSDDTIAFFKVDKETRQVRLLEGAAIPAGLGIYGSCLYRSPEGRFYLFVNAKSGDVIQWQLEGTPEGAIHATEMRRFSVGSQVEACVTDDENRAFYISEEEVGVWKYAADPEGGSHREAVDKAGEGHLTADVEGLALYKAPDGGGYLVVSSQGDSSYALYERSAPHRFAGRFQITFNDGETVRHTDGIEAASVSLSDAFPQGLLVVQDGYNAGRRQNFKYVSWQEIERQMGR